MGIRWYSVVIDCKDVQAQASWWGQALGWVKSFEAPDEVVLVAPYVLTDAATPVDRRGPELVFIPVPEGKSVKNRLHLDLAPFSGDDQAAEVSRLVGLGATPVDVGQGDSTWVVLADPEGNEFCVLSPRD
jgi:hypothetical protein